VFWIHITALSLCVKYWHNIVVTNGSPNILLKSAVISETIKCAAWVNGIEYLLKMSGLNYIWDDPNSVSNKFIYNALKRKLTDQYIQSWFADNTHRQYIFKDSKHSYEYSSYLSVIQSSQIRSIFTKLRINNSILRCSYRNTENSCPMCAGVAETIQHLLLECQQLVPFMARMNTYIYYVTSRSPEVKLSILLNLDSTRLANKSLEGDFISIISR
jgi:hypothetical protein